MKGFSLRMLHCAGPLALLFCLAPLQADPPQRPLARLPERVMDVSLNQDSILEGYLIDPFGKVLKETSVTLVQNRKIIWTGKTDANGHFQVQGLSTGVYRVDSDRLTANCRIWNCEAAPPRASRSLLLTRDPTSREVPGSGFEDLTIRVSGFPSLMLPRMMMRDIRQLKNP